MNKIADSYFFFFFLVIEEGNWLTLHESMKEYSGGEGFDALICMGNSFAHLPDFRWSHLLFCLEFQLDFHSRIILTYIMSVFLSVKGNDYRILEKKISYNSSSYYLIRILELFCCHLLFLPEFKPEFLEFGNFSLANQKQ